MQDGRAGRQPRCREVGVQIAEEEHRLKEREDRRPDAGGPAEHGEHQATDEWLDAEQQER
jgi:hypothetical protein